MKRQDTKLQRLTQRGVSLLEVLIAVLVLSFGLLGLAGLQLTALRSNQSALERSNAIMQTYAIVDAMHADRATARSGGFNLALGAAAPTDGSFAAQSLTTWRTALIQGLGPAATGSVACVVGVAPAPDLTCTITVRWDDSRGLGGSDMQTIVTQVQL